VQISKQTEFQVTISQQQQNQNSTQSINTTDKFLTTYNQLKICGKTKAKIPVKTLQSVNKITSSVPTTTAGVQPKANSTYETLQYIQTTNTTRKATT